MDLCCILYHAAPAPVFSQAAPAPGIFFRAAPDPAPRGQKHVGPVKFGKLFSPQQTTNVKLQEI